MKHRMHALKVVFGVAQVLTLVLGVGIIGTMLVISGNIFGRAWVGNILIFLILIGLLMAVVGAVGFTVVRQYSPVLVFVYVLLSLALINLEILFFMRETKHIAETREWTSKIWMHMSDRERNKIQSKLDCCGFLSRDDRPGTQCKSVSGCYNAIEKSTGLLRTNSFMLWIPVLAVQSLSISFSTLLCRTDSSHGQNM